MSGKRGAVVVLEASSGKVLAMYSNPTFDPTTIGENWNTLSTDEENSPLLNRATKGLYPPGSIFKVITALAYMRQNEQAGLPLDFAYDCTGSISGNEYTIQCFNGNVHGEVDLYHAFAKSCNSYFVALARELNPNALKETAESLGFNQPLNVDLGYSTSRFNLQIDDSEFEKAATAIGQGRTLTTPLHMAILAATIINDGVSMKPYLVDYTMKHGRQIINRQKPVKVGNVLEEQEAYELQSLMEGVVDHGTAVTLPEKNLVVGGKTGTAQNETQADHSWFMGYAYNPDEGPRNAIAFAVVVEGGGKGAQALTVSDSILEAYRSES